MICSWRGVEKQFNLNHPDLKPPMQMEELAGVIAYHAGESQPADEEEQKLRIELEEKVESYYQSAHRVLKLFGRVSALRKIKCVVISRARNQLIEHPKDGTLYSFGVGPTGPRVKAMHDGKPEFDDAGLVPNTQDFVSAIVAACASTAPFAK